LSNSTARKLFYAPRPSSWWTPRQLRRYLPDLIKFGVEQKRSIPARWFDLTLPLDQVAEGLPAAMDERRAIKALLRPTQ